MDILPDTVILQILKYLDYVDMCHVSQTNLILRRVSGDQILWRNLVRRHFGVDTGMFLEPLGHATWKEEFKRFMDETPMVEVEVLAQHTDQVLHVSFSHDGNYFATSSKDGMVIVWEVGYPVKFHFSQNMRPLGWRFTHYSQFNESDSRLLVSGMLPIQNNCTSSEIAIFELKDGLQLVYKIASKPYDLFGPWLSDSSFLSGDYQWLNGLVSRTTVKLNTIEKDSEEEEEPISPSLFKFFNPKGSSVRSLLIANCAENSTVNISSRTEDQRGEQELLSDSWNKWLIFTCATATYTPHCIGFKKIDQTIFDTKIESELPQAGSKNEDNVADINWADYPRVAHQFDKLDHIIDLHGHILGMALSPDHHHLYVNSRSWPAGYEITNPLRPPPISNEIDIIVIDLKSMSQVGMMQRAHRAFTRNEDCFFLFMDASDKFLASGAEDRHGYVWDRHYGTALMKLKHRDVVNSVAFNPHNSQMLVTVSDDCIIKIWRSREECRNLGLDVTQLNMGSRAYKPPTQNDDN